MPTPGTKNQPRYQRTFFFFKWKQPDPETAEKLADILYEYRLLYLKSSDQAVVWEKVPDRMRIPQVVRYYLQRKVDREEGNPTFYSRKAEPLTPLAGTVERSTK